MCIFCKLCACIFSRDTNTRAHTLCSRIKQHWSREYLHLFTYLSFSISAIYGHIKFYIRFRSHPHKFLYASCSSICSLISVCLRSMLINTHENVVFVCRVRVLAPSNNVSCVSVTLSPSTLTHSLNRLRFTLNHHIDGINKSEHKNLQHHQPYLLSIYNLPFLLLICNQRAIVFIWRIMALLMKCFGCSPPPYP